MTGLEPRISGVGSNHSTTCATNTASNGNFCKWTLILCENESHNAVYLPT